MTRDNYQQFGTLEAEFCESKAATPSPQTTDQVSPPQSPSCSSDSTGSEGKPLLPSDLIYGPDGKQLKPLQLTFAQFMLANFKIVEAIMPNNPTGASDYLRYLKFLATKGTRFQAKAILAFDQDYRATKSRDKFSWGLTSMILAPSILMQQLPYALHLLRLPRVLPTVASPSTMSFVFDGILAPMVALVPSPADTNMFAFTVHNRTKANIALAPLRLAAEKK